jgi:hypothetical protein
MSLQPATTLFQRQLQANKKRNAGRHVFHSSSSSESQRKFEDEDENEDEFDLYCFKNL